MSRSEFIALPLAELCNDMFSGGTPSTSNSGFWNGSYKWLSSGETRNNFIYDTEKTITDEAINKSSTKLARAKDIVMASAGQGKTRGQTSLLMTDTYINQSIIAIRPNEKIHYKYLYYYLKSKYEELRVASDGSSIRGSITTKDLKDFIIELPSSRTHQMKIAQVLFSYDNLIENNNRRIAILEEMAQRLYREWFVHFRFPGHENVKMVESELGLIPEGWEIKKAGDILSTQYGYTETASTKEIGPKYVRGTDINKQSYINWDSVPFCSIDSKNYDKYKLKRNDVLIIRMADPGKIGIVENNINAVFASYLIRLTPIGDCLTPYYLFYTANSSTFQDFVLGASTGATRKSISAETIKEAKILTPPNILQEKFDKTVIPYRNMINKLLEQNENLRKTRDHLLPRLISGDIDVSDLPIKTKED